jgi:pimeloyl-ACP methyl ester carboxylesterase
MTGFNCGRLRLLVGACFALVALAVAAPATAAKPPKPALAFTPCGLSPSATRTECATADLPLDYDHANDKNHRVQIAVARVAAVDQAHRLGALFFNFGGPGGTAVDYLQFVGASGLWNTLNQRYDIVGFDPRGVGQSSPSIDCHVNQQTTGIYSVPVATPLTLDPVALITKDKAYIDACLDNGEILEHVSTANVARDMDSIRSLLGESKLNYFGYSYGTLLGATYASLFPNNYRAMVLDGPVDANRYLSKPWQQLAEQSAGFERAFGRFMQACAANQAACHGFGGSDPWDAYDQLVDGANESPIPATGYGPDPRPVTGDEINIFTIFGGMYAKENWSFVSGVLAETATGDGSLLRLLVDEFIYGRNPDDGTYSPANDRYFTIGATEQKYLKDQDFYYDRGDEAWALFPHAYLNNGYVELNYALWPKHDKDAYYGPFKIKSSSPTPLVVATTYDPATPYAGALRYVRDLGNVRLITMRGDGHTAYGGESACIDLAVERYLLNGVLPAKGTTCKQDTPFSAFAAATGSSKALSVASRRLIAGHGLINR